MADLWEDMIVVDTRDKLKDFNVEAHVLCGLITYFMTPRRGICKQLFAFSTLYDFAFRGMRHIWRRRCLMTL